MFVSGALWHGRGPCSQSPRAPERSTVPGCLLRAAGQGADLNRSKAGRKWRRRWKKVGGRSQRSTVAALKDPWKESLNSHQPILAFTSKYLSSAYYTCQAFVVATNSQQKRQEKSPTSKQALTTNMIGVWMGTTEQWRERHRGHLT